jgi:hypothetical protein
VIRLGEVEGSASMLEPNWRRSLASVLGLLELGRDHPVHGEELHEVLLSDAERRRRPSYPMITPGVCIADPPGDLVDLHGGGSIEMPDVPRPSLVPLNSW